MFSSRLFALALALAGAGAQAAPTFLIEDLGQLGSTSITARNSIGGFAGSQFLYRGSTLNLTAGAYDHGTTVFAVGLPVEIWNSEAKDINDHGQVVGTVEIGNETRGFSFQGGEVTYLDRFIPRGVNNSGVMVGSYNDGTQTWQPAIRYADRLELFEHRNVFLSDISNAGHVVGHYVTGRPQLHDVYNVPYANSAGFVYHEGELITFEHLAGVVTRPRGVNSAGHVIGTYMRYDEATARVNPDEKAFLYGEGQFFDLASLMPEDSGFDLYYPIDIDDDGRLLVRAFGDDGMHYLLLTPLGDGARASVSAVPEAPATLMMGSALALLCARLRRSRRAA